jgi:hypothetical protein
MAITKKKAAKILSDKKVRGKKLTKKQRGYMGAVASGKAKKKAKKKKVVTTATRRRRKNNGY